MHLRENISLQHYNTFGIDVKADHYVELSSQDEIISFINNRLENYPDYLILGGGSNVLFVNHFHGLVIHLANKGITIVDEDDEHVRLQVNAGENWDDLVSFCVEAAYGGIENLSMIPGSVGAAPIQNIGAYGVELKDHFNELQALNLLTGRIEVFTHEECQFSYRNSIFKNKLKGQYLILNISIILDKIPSFQTSYGVIEQELQAMQIDTLSIKSIREAVCNIRSRKLPDPEEIGNGGSFFKNPVVNNELYKSLVKEFPGIVSYPHGEMQRKLAAGWLIEKAGWKGYRKGDAGVHSEQALVLVNYGKASGQDILNLSEEIRSSVFEMFQVDLEREINVV